VTTNLLHRLLGMQVCFTMAGIVGGAILFEEFAHMSKLAIAMFALGLIGMAAGIVFSISPAAMRSGLQQLVSKLDESDHASGVVLAIELDSACCMWTWLAIQLVRRAPAYIRYRVQIRHRSTAAPHQVQAKLRMKASRQLAGRA
jgi:uncharacterized membrane protein HdeD (DUF308 family)